MEKIFNGQEVESDDFYYGFYGCLDIEMADFDYDCDHAGDCSFESIEWLLENEYKLREFSSGEKDEINRIIDGVLNDADPCYLLNEEKELENYYSYENMCVSDEEINQNLIDCDFEDRIIGDMMVKEFINNLNDNEKYILSCLLNGMTHQEISDTMDCTRQNVTRTVERLGTKAIDFLSCN